MSFKQNIIKYLDYHPIILWVNMVNMNKIRDNVSTFYQNVSKLTIYHTVSKETYPSVYMCFSINSKALKST